MNIQDLGNNIRELRIKKELKQNDLASALNISPQAVSKWENGENAPDIALLPKLANIFSVSIDTLLGFNCEENSTFEASVFVSDIEMFTQRVKKMELKDIVTIINGFYFQLTESILKYNGIPVKYIGDEFICFFTGENHKRRAIKAAVHAKKVILDKVSIGLSFGDIYFGKIGHPDYAQKDILGQCITYAHKLCYWAREKTESKIATIEYLIEDFRDEIETGYSENFTINKDMKPVKIYEIKGY